MSKAGGRYRAANGSRIPNLGQQDVAFQPPEGYRCNLQFQVAEVTRPLISVSKLGRAGHTAVFEEKSGYILNNRTQKRIQLLRLDGVYILPMRVSDSSPKRVRFAVPPSEASQGCPRRGP